MKTFTLKLDIDRTPEAVFAYISEPLNFPEWQPDVVGVEWEGAGGRVGSRFVTRRHMLGGVQSYVQEVTQQVPFRSWAAKGVEGVLRPSTAVDVEPIDSGTRSRVTFSLSYDASPAGRLLLPIVERGAPKQAQGSYDLLKQILERHR